MLDKLYDMVRKHLRPPGATPIFQLSPDGRSGLALVQESEHQYKVHSFAGPKGVRPNHTYDSLYDLVGDLLFRARTEQLDPEDCPVRCKASIDGGSIEVVSDDRNQDYDHFQAVHPVSSEWASWRQILGKTMGPAKLMELVRYLVDSKVVVLEDGDEPGQLLERETDFAALVQQQMGNLRVATALESMSTTLKNGLVIAEGVSRDRTTTAKLPDEFFIRCPILDGGQAWQVRVVVCMEVVNASLQISLVIPPAQVDRLRIDLSAELRDRVARGLGEGWSVAVGTIGEREVFEAPKVGPRGGGLEAFKVELPSGFVEFLRQAERDAPPPPPAPADGGPVDSTPS